MIDRELLVGKADLDINRKDGACVYSSEIRYLS